MSSRGRVGADDDLHVVQGCTRYTGGRVYENLWLLRLGGDGRASAFTEWYTEAASSPLGPGASEA